MVLKRKKILMVVRQFYPWAGGTERQAQKLASKLIDFGIDVEVVTGWWSWDTPRLETVDNIPVYRNFTLWGMLGIKGLRKFGAYIYIFSLLWYLVRHRREYDLIHIHLLSYPAFPAVLVGRLFGKVTVIKIANTGHYSDIRRMEANDMVPGQRLMLPATLRADCFIALNEKIVEELQDVGVALDRMTVIPNGVNVNSAHTKSDYGIKSEVTLVFVGRLHPQKDLFVLLDAFELVVGRRPDTRWRLWLLGDGTLRLQLERMTKEMGFSEEVTFFGQVNDVSIYLNKTDIFVMPSKAEGMSNALMEAMAHGLPCVASRVNGNEKLIQDNVNGLLVKRGDSADLANAIVTLAEDESLRQSIGRAAYETVRDNYSMDYVARRYISLYHSLLNK